MNRRINIRFRLYAQNWIEWYPQRTPRLPLNFQTDKRLKSESPLTQIPMKEFIASKAVSISTYFSQLYAQHSLLAFLSTEITRLTDETFRQSTLSKGSQWSVVQSWVVDMDGDIQRAIAIWVFLITLFLSCVGFLHLQAELTMFVIVLFWVPQILLTLIGVIPPPWKPISD